jgi:hypothetical protein
MKTRSACGDTPTTFKSYYFWLFTCFSVGVNEYFCFRILAKIYIVLAKIFEINLQMLTFPSVYYKKGTTYEHYVKQWDYFCKNI